jgi:hypothetical protein
MVRHFAGAGNALADVGPVGRDPRPGDRIAAGTVP